MVVWEESLDPLAKIISVSEEFADDIRIIITIKTMIMINVTTISLKIVLIIQIIVTMKIILMIIINMFVIKNNINS